MQYNLEVLRQEKDIETLTGNEQALLAPCLKDLSFFVIEKQNGYRENLCPICGKRIYAHGSVIGHDR